MCVVLKLAGSDSSQDSSTVMMRLIMSNDCCPISPSLSGPMQRSSEFIACTLFRSILDSSNRHHGVNRTYLLSRGLFHPFAVETLESVLAEVQLLHDVSKMTMMLSLSS